MNTPIIVWFRQDLRVEDNPALFYAAQEQSPILPLYIFDTTIPRDWQLGGASKWWLHHSLTSLHQSLKDMGLPLILRKGNPINILSEMQAQAIYFNRCYEPFALKRDQKVENKFETRSFKGSLLVEPWEIATRAGAHFRVFTPFWKSCSQSLEVESPLPKPKPASFHGKIVSDRLEGWNLLPKHPNWAKEIEKFWQVGEKAAHQRLKKFCQTLLEAYKTNRDILCKETSFLSPHFHFGEVSPRQVWHAASDNPHSEPFLKELFWREFSYHLLYHHPNLPSEPLDKRFEQFPWKSNKKGLQAWQRGETGYPIVDAGMRQLWQIGWMHNRVRMVVASFLIKDLMIHWKEGEKWFWDTLVDADLANNAASWQWVAGCGADAQPFFRVFNPILQGEKFDPEGEYVKKWVPELQNLEPKWIHKPWLAPKDVLQNAGITLGTTYPFPTVDHQEARKHALEAFQNLR